MSGSQRLRTALGGLLLGSLLFASHPASADPLFHSTYYSIRQYVATNMASPFAVADVNEDGAPDLIYMPMPNEGPVRIRFGDGYGNLGPEVWPDGVATMSATAVYGLALVDVNGDRHLDLVLGGALPNAIYVLLGHGDGTFDPPIASPTSFPPYSISVGDFNEDGRVDLVLGGLNRFGGSTAFGIACGDGTGRFAQTYYSTVEGGMQVAIADLNRDGHLDFVTNYGGVHLGDGQGGLLGSGTSAHVHAGQAVAICDLDGDGWKDIVSGDENGKLSIYYGDSTGTYSSARNTSFYVDGGWVSSMAAGDLDYDGRPEVVVAGSVLSVFKATAGGGLALKQVLPGPPQLNVTLGDLDGDGRPDVIAGTGGQLSVYLTTPGGSWYEAPFLPLTGNPGAVVAGDLDSDGRARVAFVLQGANQVEIVRTAADGTPSLESLQAVGRGPSSIAAGDMDGDGRLDLVVADSTDAAITILQGQPGGTWARQDVPGVTGMHWVGIADVDQDGHPDIVTIDRPGGIVYVLRGSGVGFGPPEVAGHFGLPPDDLRLADFNGDGDPDLVMTGNTNNVYFLAGGAGISFVSPPYRNNPMVPGGYELAVADFDRDSLLDVYTAGLGQGESGLAHNLGDFKFGGGEWGYVSYVGPFQDGITHLTTGDVDNDGSPDLLFALWNRPFVMEYRGLGNEQFAEALWGYGFSGATLGRCLLADVTGDGQADLIAFDAAGTRLYVAPHTGSLNVAVPPAPARAAKLAFAGSMPNPMQGQASLRFNLGARGGIRVTVLDTRGRIVRHLDDRVAPAGPLAETWDGRDDRGARVGPGIYFARLATEHGAVSGKLVVL